MCVYARGCTRDPPSCPTSPTYRVYACVSGIAHPRTRTHAWTTHPTFQDSSARSVRSTENDGEDRLEREKERRGIEERTTA